MFPRAESDPTLTSAKGQKTFIEVSQKSHVARKMLDLNSAIELLTSRSIVFKLIWVAGIRPRWPELGQGPNSGHVQKLIKNRLKTMNIRLFSADLGS